MKIDPRPRRSRSRYAARAERWDSRRSYQPGQMVKGASEARHLRAFARFEGPVEGLIHVSELVDRRITHPKEVVKEGDVLPLRIVRIERDSRHRLGLSLRARVISRGGGLGIDAKEACRRSARPARRNPGSLVARRVPAPSPNGFGFGQTLSLKTAGPRRTDGVPV